MMKYFVLCLLAISCRGAPVYDDQPEDSEENAYATAYIKFNGYENNMLTSEQCTDDKIDVIFKLFTRENPNGHVLVPTNNETMKNSSFNIKQDTKILIHDWLQNETHSYARDFVSAFLKNKRESVNVITVDYGSVSRCDFKQLRQMQPVIGQRIAQMLKSLMRYGTVPSKLHLIGLGMGAQIAGISARQIHPRKVGRLTALDPTFIGYLNNKPQLVSNDSDYMDVIHTAQRKLDVVKHLGNARFFPNDGTRQPLAAGKSSVDAGVLSHIASALYYLESIVDITYFKARQCRDYLTYTRNQCSTPAIENHMGDEVNITLKGNFYLQTQSQLPPFGNRDLEVKVFENIRRSHVKARPVGEIDVSKIATAKQQYERKRSEEKNYNDDEINTLINEYSPSRVR